jgi:hypothetical protein
MVSLLSTLVDCSIIVRLVGANGVITDGLPGTENGRKALAPGAVLCRLAERGCLEGNGAMVTWRDCGHRR